MLKTLTLLLALAATGIAVTSVAANAAPANFINKSNGSSQADTACTPGNFASYCN